MSESGSEAEEFTDIEESGEDSEVSSSGSETTYELEDENEPNTKLANTNHAGDSGKDRESGLFSHEVAGHYCDEPIASEQWLKKYNSERKEAEAKEEELQKRKDGVVSVDSWYVNLHSLDFKINKKLQTEGKVFLVLLTGI